MTGFGNSLEEITQELEECENLINALAVDGNKARNLLRAGKELMLEHPFTRESLGNVRKQHASNNPKINYSNGAIARFLDILKCIIYIFALVNHQSHILRFDSNKK